MDRREGPALGSVAEAFDIDDRIVAALADRHERARLLRHDRYVALTLLAVEDQDGRIVEREIDLVAGRNFVITVHEGRVRAFEAFIEQVRGERRLGELDAAAFMAALVDSQLSSYFDVIEDIERRIDELDERALRSRRDGLLDEMVRLRRLIARLRRALAPHREAFAPLVRPDFELHDELGRPWPGLTERLERTIDSVENARELLVGSFDIHMGRLAQRTNDIVKVLTIVSSLLLPSVVLAGVMGMNFQMPWFDDEANFWVVVAAMAVMAAAILAVARRRDWI